MSYSGRWAAHSAASAKAGPGTMTLAELTAPSSSAIKVARFTEWHMPRSSAWIISSLEYEEYPRSCAISVTRMSIYINRVDHWLFCLRRLPDVQGVEG